MKNYGFQMFSICGRVLLALLLVQGCRQKGSTDKPPPGAYFKTHFQDESQFIVEALITDLAEMIYYAQHKSIPERLSVSAVETKGTAFRKPVYAVHVDFGSKIPSVSAVVRVDRPIWEPA